MGFKGSRKSTAYAAQMVAQDAARQAMAHGMKEVEIRVKGPGSGRESAIRAMQAIGLEISAIKDVTPGAAQRLPPAQETPRVIHLKSQIVNYKFLWLVIQVPASASAAVSAFRFSARRNISNAATTVPGVHGPKSRRKTTEYGEGLNEKQKLRYYYGLMEKQFRGVYEKALSRRGVTGETMLQILETRLDNVVFHLGFGNTRAAARQMVNHGHVTVNGRKAAIASFALKVNDVIMRQEPQRVAPARDEEFGSFREPRGAGLVVLEQGRVQGHGHAHPDPRRNPADRQRAGRRRILFPLTSKPKKTITRAVPAGNKFSRESQIKIVERKICQFV